ncbi:small conductance mechanosensitive channel [Diaminobutyricimonas aerilata]|uniref:Small conductance mechanosensitive channel n=1 Tax=Diaminobutyricimonas aerilata TaxID=1162967 RepID=A0A2M9CJ45_9MICO|nr:mechanosensitive ion channel domain-containing protein [Diaminobutyricimonas aerilata]PJJ71914.1 small conductance mechanosensitive channel [Diaminobutyricimonas aerilata]
MFATEAPPSPSPGPQDMLDAVFNWESPLGKFLTVLIIIAILAVVRIILHFVIRAVVDRIVNGFKRRQNVEDTQSILASPLAAARTVQRTRTLGAVLSNIVTTVVVVIGLLMVLTTVVPNVTSAFALITAALGAGLGFGAQNIIKDVLNGLFMVIEDQLGVGDVVDLGPATGVVETVGIRITQVRDVNGTLWFVRNGEILRVGNMSLGWSRVILDLAVPYEADVDTVQQRMLETANELAADPKWRARVVEKPEIWGIESISAEAVVVRLVVKTRSGVKDDVARELRVRLKRSLDEMGVRLPALNTIVLSGFEGAASVKGARPPRTGPVDVPAEPKKPRRRPARDKETP